LDTPAADICLGALAALQVALPTCHRFPISDLSTVYSPVATGIFIFYIYIRELNPDKTYCMAGEKAG
jgi:hypothetical protein